MEYEDFYKKFRPSALKDFFDNGIYIKLPKAKETDPQPLLIRGGVYIIIMKLILSVCIKNLLNLTLRSQAGYTHLSWSLSLIIYGTVLNNIEELMQWRKLFKVNWILFWYSFVFGVFELLY